MDTVTNWPGLGQASYTWVYIRRPRRTVSGRAGKEKVLEMNGQIQSVKLQCVDCEMRFTVFLRLAPDTPPMIERSSNVRRANGKYVHLCGGAMRLLKD